MTDPSNERSSTETNENNLEDAVLVGEGNTNVASGTESSTSTAAAEVTDDSTVAAHPEPYSEPVSEPEPEIVSEAEPVTADSTVEAHYDAEAAPVVTHGTETAAGPSAAGEPRVVYVTAPTPPKVAGNRGFGVFLGLASTLAFAVLYAITVIIIAVVRTGRVTAEFVQLPSFYVPVAFFAVAAIIVALIVNRAGWAAHVVASIFVALIVYFGTIGVLLLANGVTQNTPEEARLLFSRALADPWVIAAALVAREVSLWTGALVAKRGRKVVQRNRDARSQWEAELAEKSAPHGG